MRGATALPLPKGLPTDLDQVSSGLSRVASRAEQTHIYRDGPSSPVLAETWTGEAAEARAKEAGVLKNRLSHATTKLPTIASAVTSYRDVLAETIESVKLWQHQWDEAQDTYMNRLRQLNHEPDQDGLDKQAIADSWADERDTEHRRLHELYALAIDDLKAAGRTAATEIRGLCDLVVPADKAGSREEIGAHVLRDMDLAGGEAMTDLAYSMREDFVEELQAAIGSDDPAVLEEFVETYGQYATDPHFAYVMASHLGADGFMKAFTHLGLGNLRYGRDDDLTDQQQAVMQVLGSLYVAASGPADGDVGEHGYNASAINRWREETWFPALTESGRRWHSFEDAGAAAGPYYGYYAQGIMLVAAAENGIVPGGDYMRHVGVDMVEWDRGITEKRGWDFAVPGMKPNFIGYEDGSALAVLAEDPLYALLHAAAQDEDSTFALLNADVGTGDEKQSVIGYLVSERGGTMPEAAPFGDQGTLIAQIVAEHGTDRTDAESTQLAGNYLNAYIDTVGRGTFANGADVSEYAFVGGRTATADVIATHIEDVIRATSTPDRGGLTFSKVPGEDTFVVHFDEETRNNFARTFGFLAMDRPEDIAYYDGSEVRGDPDNPPALQRIINAAVAYNAARLQEGLATFDGDWVTYPPTPAVTAVHEGAGFLTYITESANLALMDNAEAEQAYNEYIKELISGGAGLVPVSNLVKGGFAGSAVDLAYSTATDGILDWMIDTDQVSRAEVTTGSANEQIYALLHDQLTSAVVENGHWPGDGPAAWAEERGLGPEETFVRDGKVMPIEEILASDVRTANFFTHYLGDEYDGGQEALQGFRDQIEEAFAFRQIAQDNWSSR